MAIPRTKKRGLSSIRTNTDRAYRGSKPHRAFLKIGSIEMEKERRLEEKMIALARIKEIDARCRELDNEKDRLLRMVGERGKQLGRTGGAGSQQVTEGKTTSDRIKEQRRSTVKRDETGTSKQSAARIVANPPPKKLTPGTRDNRQASGSVTHGFRIRY